MFHDFRFPRLKSLVINSEGDLGQYLTEEKEKKDYDWSWLPSTLEDLIVCDWVRYERPSLLTGSFLRDTANSCPGLKRVWFKAASFGFEPADLARFFRCIRPWEVRLDFGSQMNHVLTCDVLSALSHGGHLETLIIGRSESDGLSGGYWRVPELAQFHEQDTAAKTFASLRSLDVSLSCEAVLWIPRCFSAVTSLRIELPGTVDESIRVPLSTMTQLRVLDFRRDDDGVEPITPATAYVILGSLFRLHTLRLSGAFKPCYVSGSSYPCIGPVQTTPTGLVPMTIDLDPDEVEDQELHWPGDWFTEEDAAEMYLEELSIDAGGQCFPDFLLQIISEFCPKLQIIESIDKISLRQFAGPKAPLFGILREMRVEHVKSAGMSACQTAEILSQVAPKLQMLVNLCDGFREGGFENDVLTAFEQSRKSRKIPEDRAL